MDDIQEAIKVIERNNPKTTFININEDFMRNADNIQIGDQSKNEEEKDERIGMK